MAETQGSGSSSAGRGKVLRRSNSSRLRMHAPSSIQVAPPSGCASEWKVAIPLLSPLALDILSLPTPPEKAPAPEKKPQQNVSSGTDENETAGLRWRHPAEPFFFEPMPSNAPGFALPHPAS